MTLSEARLVARLIGFADRGCSNCVSDLVDHANRKFPDFIWTVGNEEDWDLDQETWKNEHGIECSDHFIRVVVKRA